MIYPKVTEVLLDVRRQLRTLIRSTHSYGLSRELVQSSSKGLTNLGPIRTGADNNTEHFRQFLLSISTKIAGIIGIA